jgi:hypothetical protein
MGEDICRRNMLCLAMVDCRGRILKVSFWMGNMFCMAMADCRGRVPGWYLDWRLLVDIQIVFKTEHWGDSEGCSTWPHECKGGRAIVTDCCMSKRKMVVHV